MSIVPRCLSLSRTRSPIPLLPLRQRTLRYSTHSGPGPHSPKPPSSSLKRLSILTCTLGLSSVVFTLGALYPPPLLTILSPRPAPPPPDPSHPSSLTYTTALESSLQSLSLLQSLRNAPDAEDWYETRPYEGVEESRRVNSLTAGALRGPGKLAIPPLLRARRDESQSVVFVHMGRGLCGHEGIVHGGLIATVLDESLGRMAILNFPEKIAVTASLTIDYKAPTRADQFVVIRCRLVELKGRKAIAEGSIEDLNGTVLATAKALFIQPRYAKLLNTKTITKIVGEPPVAAARLSGGDPAPVPPDGRVEA